MRTRNGSTSLENGSPQGPFVSLNSSRFPLELSPSLILDSCVLPGTSPSSDRRLPGDNSYFPRTMVVVINVTGEGEGERRKRSREGGKGVFLDVTLRRPLVPSRGLIEVTLRGPGRRSRGVQSGVTVVRCYLWRHDGSWVRVCYSTCTLRDRKSAPDVHWRYHSSRDSSSHPLGTVPVFGVWVVQSQINPPDRRSVGISEGRRVGRDRTPSLSVCPFVGLSRVVSHPWRLYESADREEGVGRVLLGMG